MSDYLIVIDFKCLDITGDYISSVIIDRRDDRYVVRYVDFDGIVSILKFNNLHYIPSTLKTLLSEESGIVPSVKFHQKEIWSKQTLEPRRKN